MRSGVEVEGWWMMGLWLMLRGPWWVAVKWRVLGKTKTEIDLLGMSSPRYAVDGGDRVKLPRFELLCS